MEVVSRETVALPACLRSKTSKFSFVESMDQVNQPGSYSSPGVRENRVEEGPGNELASEFAIAIKFQSWCLER